MHVSLNSVIEILCKNMLTAYERQFIENVTLVMAKDSLHYAVNLFLILTSPFPALNTPQSTWHICFTLHNYLCILLFLSFSRQRKE